MTSPDLPTSVAGSTSSPRPTCGQHMNPGGHCPDPWHSAVTAQPSPDLPDNLQRRGGYAQGGISPEPIRMVERDVDEQFIPDVGHATASDLALVARATGGGIRSAELIPAYEDDELPRISPRRDLSQVRSLQAQIAQLTGDRDDWKARCEQAWTQLDQAQADLAAMTARTDQLAATLTRVLGAFYERGHPGYPAYRSGWVSETNLAEWQRVAVTETAPGTAPASTWTGPQATVVGVDGPDGPGGSEGDSGGAE